MSPEHQREMLSATRSAAIALVEDLDHLRQVGDRETPSAGEIRRMSNPLRKLLIDGAGDIRLVGAPRVGRVAIPAPDNTPYYRSVDRGEVVFFSSGYAAALGIQIRAWAMFRGSGDPAPQHDPEAKVSLPLDSFLTQRVIYFNGVWARRKDVIQYMANIAHGVHSGTAKEPSHVMLSQVERYARIERWSDGLPTISANFRFEGTPWKPYPYDAAAISVVQFELLAAAKLVCEAPDVHRLQEAIRAEINAPQRIG